ncbi:MAG: ATP-dependent DNA helicase PcrA [Acidimicrobiaceae bacterium]|nr:ATP-dependent DNA helicase PcrA [Acidimicrobiaceae bacterium]
MVARLEDDRIDDGLNPAQLDAVTHSQGPLLVVAGAGSGKTRVLTRRIAHLIGERGVSPFGILAITFTNKAAGEMKERVARLVGDIAHRMWVSTFHSACVRILRRDAERIGYPSRFSIYDQGDSTRLVGQVVRDLGLDAKRYPSRGLQAAISAAKNDGLDAGAYADRATGPHEARVADVFTGYQQRLLAAGAMDFDDLLGNAVRLLRGHPEVLADHRRRFEHILVDEYQDTNSVQNELVLLLAEEHRNVCVVGDSDQSIYQFRGADVRNILEFEQAFPDATVVVLDQNYRSTQTILDAANAVITRNEDRPPKDLWTDAGPGDRIVRYRADDEDDEARWITRRLAGLHDSGRRAWSDLAVFYRTNAQSRAIEEQLIRFGVPYRVVGGTRFYDRREVRDALAYLRLAANPADEVAARRVLNVPKRGIGDTSVARVDAWAQHDGTTFTEALGHAEEAGVSGRAAAGIRGFLDLLDDLTARVDDGPGAVLEAALDRSGYLDELRAEHTIEAEGRLENLAELVGVAAEFDSVDEYLEQVGLVADTDQLPDADDVADGDGSDDGQVVLMTLHAAKGLEFPVVFLAGVEEGVFPHVRSLADPQQLEEERRLAYVGITRARELLHVSHAWTRMLHGATQYNPPSRFLDEIPEALIVESEDGRKARRSPGGGWRDRHDRGGRKDRWDDDTGSQVADDGEPGGSVIGAGTRAPAGVGGLRAPAATGAHELGLAAGERVVHGAWGEGVVVAVSGVGDRTEAVVRFPSVGEKRLLLAWAPITRA